MRKTFCDSCGKECVNRTVQLHISQIHTTKHGQAVAEDEYRSVELCGTCGDEVKRSVALDFDRFLLHRDQAGTVDEMRAVERPIG